MTWSKEAAQARRDRLPKDWARLRRQVLARDGYRCVALLADGSRCAEVASDVDHIVAMLDDNRLEALQSLCGAHHRYKSSSEGGKAKADKQGRMRRPPERHPGIR
jgi:5-methylcytosine-specific restriction protein A